MAFSNASQQGLWGRFETFGARAGNGGPLGFNRRGAPGATLDPALGWWVSQRPEVPEGAPVAQPAPRAHRSPVARAAAAMFAAPAAPVSDPGRPFAEIAKAAYASLNRGAIGRSYFR